MTYTIKELILDGREQKVDFLLKNGKFTVRDLMKRDAHRNTPLHWAASCGTAELVLTLLKQGAGCCKGMRNDSKKTPYDIAKLRPMPEAVLSLLKPTLPKTTTVTIDPSPNKVSWL